MLSNHLFSIKLPNCFVFDGACPRHNCLQPGCPHEYFHLSHNEGNVNISVCLCLNVNFLLCLVHLLQATLSLWNIPDGLSFQQTYLFPKPLAHQNLGQRTGFFFFFKYQMCISIKWRGQWEVVVAIVTKRCDVSWAHLPSSWPRPWERKSETVCGHIVTLVTMSEALSPLQTFSTKQEEKKKLYFMDGLI